ncbi:MAG: ABC transporter substrate-binding protein [Candidatus Dormibacteria bacterium]
MRANRPVLVLSAALALAACGTSTNSTTATTTAKVPAPPDSALFMAGTLTIGSDISYPPQEFYDPPGSKTPTGFDIELGKGLADHMGLKFEAVNQTFDGIIPSLDAKKYDIIISAMTINDDRKQKVDFVPYFSAGESFVIPSGGTHKPTKLEDLCGLNVAVEKGTAEESEAQDQNKSGGKCASNKIKIQSFETDTEALAQMKKGTVDVHFTDSPVAGYEIKKQTGIAISGGVIEVAPEGIAVRKGDTKILDAIKAAFKSMEDDGSYKALLTKWGVADGDITKS